MYCWIRENLTTKTEFLYFLTHWYQPLITVKQSWIQCWKNYLQNCLHKCPKRLLIKKYSRIVNSNSIWIGFHHNAAPQMNGLYSQPDSEHIKLDEQFKYFPIEASFGSERILENRQSCLLCRSKKTKVCVSTTVISTYQQLKVATHIPKSIAVSIKCLVWKCFS